MNRRGRAASVPPGDHSRPEAVAAGGLVVRHVNRAGGVAEYDFALLPVAVPMQHSLAALFAARCTPHHWTSHHSSRLTWQLLRKFAAFIATQDPAPADVDELTAALLKRWRLSQSGGRQGYNAITRVSSLLRKDPRLAGVGVAEELAVRVRRPVSGVQSYSEAEFDAIRAAARRCFRAALIRINDNARHLRRWRAGDFVPGSRESLIGEALDSLARTGDIPRRISGAGAKNPVWRFHRALGGSSPALTWQRLFLSRLEAVALGVLLMCEFGWNLSVIHRLEVPRAAPDPGPDGRPTYRIPLEKYRRGNGRVYESVNVTDDGAGTAGRLITQALEATRFARAVVEDLAPGTDVLLVWRWEQGGAAIRSSEHHTPVGLFRFGIHHTAANEWARRQGFAGSPFRRGRRTVNALLRREAGQNSQATHDRHYVLTDAQVQAGAGEVIASGAQDAARSAQATVAASFHTAPQAGDLPTVMADCCDFEHGPYPGPDGGCAASFLMCLGCTNARIHPGHHPRLAHLHGVVEGLRSVLPAPVWARDWSRTHARLQDVQARLGDGVWEQARERIGDEDRLLVDHLLSGALEP